MLVFKVPAYSYTASTADQSFAYEMAWIDLKQLLFSLRRLDTDPPATELTVRGSLIHSHKLNMWVGGSISGCWRRWAAWVCPLRAGRGVRSARARGRCGRLSLLVDLAVGGW